MRKSQRTVIRAGVREREKEREREREREKVTGIERKRQKVTKGGN